MLCCEANSAPCFSSCLLPALAAGHAHLHAARDRQRGAERTSRAPSSSAPRPHYLEEVHSERGQMRRPAAAADTGGNSLSWRPRGGGGDQERRGGRDGDRGRGREEQGKGGSRAEDDAAQPVDRGGEERDKAAGGSEVRRGEPGREDAPGRDREGERSGKGEGRRRSPEQRRGGGEGSGDPPRRPERREDDRDRRGGADAQRRPRSPPRGRPNGAAPQSDDGDRGGAAGNREQAAALMGVAGLINEFNDDGSFLERFQRQKGGVAAVKGAPPGALEPSEKGDRVRDGGDDDDVEREARLQEETAARRAANREAARRLRDEAVAAAGGAEPGGTREAGEAPAPGVGVSNKSVAEMLRAKLKVRANLG